MKKGSGARPRPNARRNQQVTPRSWAERIHEAYPLLQARSPRLHGATEAARQHVATILDLHARHVDAWLGIADRTLTAPSYSPRQALSDAMTLTLDAYATWADCLENCSSAAEDDDLALFDQCSEVVGPILPPCAGPAPSQTVKEPPVQFRGPGGVVLTDVTIRRLPEGYLHVVVAPRAAKVPDGAYEGNVQSGSGFAPGPNVTVTVTKVTRARTSQAVGFGVPVPSALMTDPDLNLRALLFE